MPMHHADVLVLGSGPAGYTAAIYSARAMQNTLIVSGLQEGGQLTITDDVENYPGFADAIGGPWLMEQMKQQAIKVGARSVNDLIVNVDLTSRPLRLTGDGGDAYTCDALIVATGAQARWLGLESETRLQGQGVSACATCDGFFYRGQDVVVVGGGNTAVEEALYLSNIAKSVTVVHRRDSFRCEKILARRLEAKENISVIWDHEIDEILAEDTARPGVSGVRIRHCTSGATSDLTVSGVFVAIGHSPATALFEGKLALTEGRYLDVAPGTTQTSVEGVFAAGDVADQIYRQAVTAAGMGCMAALDAERWLVTRAVNETQRQAA